MTSRGLPSVLVIDDDEMILQIARVGLESEGIAVITASDGAQAMLLIHQAVPDVIVCDVNMPHLDGYGLLQQLRSMPRGRGVPFIFLTSRAEPSDAVTGMRMGADDYVSKPFDVLELVARVRSKLDRPSVPLDERGSDVQTGLPAQARFLAALAREEARAQAARTSGVLAIVDVDERESLEQRFGSRGDSELAQQVTPLLQGGLQASDLIGRDSRGRFLVLLPDRDPDSARRVLGALSRLLADHPFTIYGNTLRLTPVIGWVLLGERAFGTGRASAAELVDRAALAADTSRAHLDLQPLQWTADLVPAAEGNHRRRSGRATRWSAWVRTPLQVLATVVLGIVVPFLGYVLLDAAGLDVSGVAYAFVVVALLVTASLIWIEGLLALDPDQPPDRAAGPPPRASAIIAAYLPNEADMILETVESFLGLDYPDLQVVLAFNTPARLPVQDQLQELAERDPRFVPFEVVGSTSKAQNVNAALTIVDGEFVGVFDADHHPARGSFSRAWRWLSNGYDVVQGHCVIRNGDDSWVARLVAVEFEAIYAVSHPGRARLHGFGVFGGSNGYWRTGLLRSIRMHGFMLTEDIDSSIRVIEQGGRIANDPALVSRELAPTTVGALWNQRMRWAQGWFQVSRKHLVPTWRSPRLTLQQKVGFTFLLGWREAYPWLALQIIPLIAFFAYRGGGVFAIRWTVAIFVLATLFTLSVGPGQVVFAYLLAIPEIRRRRSWFVSYLVLASLAYTEWKNIIGRVAQVKEVTGERQWKVTPRTPIRAQSERVSS